MLKFSYENNGKIKGRVEMSTYNKRELASLLGISKRTLERWTNELGLPYKRAGSIRKVYFDEEQVMQWMEQRTKLVRGGY